MSQQPATASLEPVDDASALPPELDLASLTPMQRQYLEIKAQNPDALLFFRLGDFYELFYDDAKVAAEFLNITLTARAKGEVRIPMCGVPYHAAKGYVARLVEAGYRVAICEQVEVPGQAKGIVRREVTRVVTPGTVFDEDGREAKTATYLAALVPAATGGALALIEATTGDFRVFVTADDGPLVEELARVEPRELLVDETDLRLASLLGSLGPQVVRTRRGPKVFEPKRGFEKLCKHFGVATLDGFGLGQRPEAWAAAGAVLAYVEETQRSALVHVRQLSTYETRGTLLIDAASRRNLDLLKNAVDGRRQGSLVGTIDRTATSMGGRLLSQWMLYPLTDVEAIGRRQEAVGELFTSAVLREDLTTVLREVGDLERLVGRLVVGQGNARDVRALGLSLRRVPDLRMLLSTCTSRMLRACADELPDLASFGEGLVQAIVDEPPSILRDGGLFRHGFHEGLDELNGLRLEGKDAILRMEAEERRRTGIPSLKIKQNSVFGYYIEVTKANLAAVPLDYVRKQTTANAERYITPVLREFEDKVFGAEERALALELALFEELRGHVVQKAEGILATARLVATLDVLLSLARAASDLGWSRPEVNEGRLLRILEGRHPVVERALGREPFVPSDLEVDEERRLVILTGPNMAGKSTAMRQVALIVILAQMGSFVPAREAVVGVADRVFTRVGAGDDLARGQSTFMVEMSETANILRHATRRSLVLLDEIGRGTSTFDGLAIAWAVAEHLHDQLQCRAIFATHYHELTELAREKAHVSNLTMAVREVADRVVFLRKLEAGAASRSYGIQVAKLAGVPQTVLARAREVLANLEKSGIDESGHAVFAKAGRRHRQAQLALGFGPSTAPESSPGVSSPVLDELKTIDANALTPLEALQLVHRWKAAVTA